MNQAVIGIGSNINPDVYIPMALEIIRKTHRCQAESRFVETEPVGYTDQPHFINGTVRIETEMALHQLKKWCARIEESLGRVRTENKFGPRTMDLDIIVWNGKIVDRDFYTREFLKKSVLEVWPDLDY